MVDDAWFARSLTCIILDTPVRIAPLEEIFWQKAYIMERERFDGADIAHPLLKCAHKIDWEHLLRRFGPDWRVLLSHLVLFGFIYPSNALARSLLQNRLFFRARARAPARARHRGWNQRVTGFLIAPSCSRVCAVCSPERILSRATTRRKNLVAQP